MVKLSPNMKPDKQNEDMDNQEVPKEEQEMNQTFDDKQKKMSKMVLGGIGVLVGGFLLVNNLSPMKSTDTPKMVESTEPSESYTFETEDSVEISEAPVEEQAREALELTDKELTYDESERGREVLQSGLDDIKGLGKENFNPSNSYDFSQTNPSMGMQIQTAFDMGYEVDVSKSEWFPSKHPNVQQFLFTMTQEGQSDVVFAGNYLISAEQIQIASMKGYINAASPSTGYSSTDGRSPQAVEDYVPYDE